MDADERVVEEQGQVLAARLRDMTFGELEITCVRNTSIEMTSSGKTRFVVNRMKARPESAPAGREGA